MPTSDLTPAELIAEARRLDAAATPGPWSINRYDNDNGSINWQVQSEADPFEVIANVTDDEPRRARHDAALIARARTLLPTLAMALERAEDQEEALRAQLVSVQATNETLAGDVEQARALLSAMLAAHEAEDGPALAAAIEAARLAR